MVPEPDEPVDPVPEPELEPESVEPEDPVLPVPEPVPVPVPDPEPESVDPDDPEFPDPPEDPESVAGTVTAGVGLAAGCWITTGDPAWVGVGFAAAGADVAAGGSGVGDGVGVGVGVADELEQPGALGKSLQLASVMAPTISPISRFSRALSPRDPSGGRRISWFLMQVVFSGGSRRHGHRSQMPDVEMIQEGWPVNLRAEKASGPAGEYACVMKRE